jgi:hypothetical protein
MLTGYYVDEYDNEIFEIEEKDRLVFYAIVSPEKNISIVKHSKDEHYSDEQLLDFFDQQKNAYSIKKIFMKKDRELLAQLALIELFKQGKMDRFTDPAFTFNPCF